MLPISWPRLLVVWMSMAIGMSANGVFRETTLKRIASSTAADTLSAALGIIIIALITRVGFAKIGATAATRALFATSIILVLFTVAFECAVGVLIDHKSFTELAAHYAIWRGELWPVVLGFLAVTPFLWSRWIPTG